VEVDAHVDRDQEQAQDESGPNSTCGETKTRTKTVACRTAASLDSTGAGRGCLRLPEAA
jgi:hypothetical protein